MAEPPRFRTRDDVEDALKAGFRSLQSRPCMTMGARLVAGQAPDAALALNWVNDFLPDQKERVALMSWVRCQAKCESWGEFCRNMGWSRSTEDKRCDRALARIVTALNADLTMAKPALDL